MNLNPIFSIAKKEILDNIRNKWVIILTILFVTLTLITSYFGLIFQQGWQNFVTTVSLMMGSVSWLIPIIGLMLGYAAIIGEIEKGSMSSLLSLPTTRLEILLGKFFGLGGVISIAIFIGFGIAGVVIGLNVYDVNYSAYLIFIFATILLGLVFLTVALFFSTIFKKRSTAIGGAVFLWIFFNILLPIIIVGVLAASIGIDNFSSGLLEFPDLYYQLNLISPLSVYSALVSLVLGSQSVESIPISYPDYYTSGLMVFILLIWIIVFLLITYWRFRNKDI